MMDGKAVAREEAAQREQAQQQLQAWKSLKSHDGWQMMAAAMDARAADELATAIGAKDALIEAKALGKFSALQDILAYPEAQIDALTAFLQPPEESQG